MSQLNDSLQAAGTRNQELLAELAQTDYAPSSMKQNAVYIADLKTQIAKVDKELSRLHTITEDERKVGDLRDDQKSYYLAANNRQDHLKYRDSNVKRWAYKLQGSKGEQKFTSKQEKEEREFLEAWQKERSAKESREELGRALEQAEKDRTLLETDAARQKRAQAELDVLYNSIFSGPTPDVPGEDQMEQAVWQSKEFLNQCQAQHRSEKSALDALSQAEQSLKGALGNIEEALRCSTWDMYGGGTFTDMMERDALANSQNCVHQTLRNMDLARHNQPAINELSEISIDHGHFFSDVMFDNIFTDMRQHERIESSRAQMQQATGHLQRELQAQKGRLQAARMQLNEASNGLEEARRELQRIRAEAFERLRGGAMGVPMPGGGDGVGPQQPPPPAYDAVG